MSRKPAVDLTARIAAVTIPAACAAFAIANPSSVLYGGAAWLVVLGCAVAGFGHVVERMVRVEVDLGLRMTWGIGAYLAIAGVCLALGTLSLPVLAVLIALGYAGFVWRQWTTPRPALIAALDVIPTVRAQPLQAAFFALLATVAVVNVAAAVAETQGNTYDDDVVYTPLIKRALDIGDIDEPFSFRRISAFGGQTALGALAATRGTLANIYLADGALCQLVMFLLVVGLIRNRAPDGTKTSRDGPPIDRVVVGLLLLNLVLLPNTSINTGSYWSGVILFFGLYRTLSLTARPDAPLTRVFALTGVLAAATCSLRQNFIPVAVLLPLAVLIMRLGKTPVATFKAERRLWLATLLGGAIALLPYCIASWRSNHTFLYPFWPGTFNTSIPTTPALQTGWQELQFWFKVVLEPDPIRAMVLLLPVIFVARDLRPGRPLAALTVASIIGFILLVHNFTLSDQHNMWRYAFGYVTALFLAIALEGAAAGLSRTADDTGPVRVPLVGRFVLIGTLLIQIALSTKGITRRYVMIADDLQLAAATHAHPDRRLEIPMVYASLQAAVPEGKTIAIALDEPFFLDYERNPIINIDTPGFASYSPGMPMFRGPEPLAAYFLDHDIRYLGFVRGAFSRYQYRREFWLRRIFLDTELWRVQGAYAVDCIDNFEALAESRKVLYERDGMVMLDLAEHR